MPAADGTISPLYPAPGLRCSSCSLRRRCLGEFGGPGRLQPLARLIEVHAPLDAGEVLYHQGERMRSVYLVQSGSLKTRVDFADGSSQVLSFHGPGSWLGFDGIADGRHSCRTEALERSRICVLPWAAAQEMALHDAQVQHHLFATISQDALAAQRHLEMMACPASRRLARFLIDQSQRRQQGSQDPLRLSLPMSREDIASFLGIAEETVCRQFTRLHEDGVLQVERRVVHIRDLAQLRRLGNGDGRSAPSLRGPRERGDATAVAASALH